MSNITIEQAGIDAVIIAEAALGRTEYERKSRCGYDLETFRRDGSDRRHIEVKSTSKSYFTSRWLEQKEQDAANVDDNFFLYLVTDALSQPKIWKHSAKKLRVRGYVEVRKYVYTFRKNEFDG